MNARRALVGSLAIAGAVATFAVGPAWAQETVKIGLSAPITGPFAENGRQMVAAVKLYVERYGANVAGKKIEVIMRDDAGVADQARRIAQELVVVNKVAILTGYNPTPPALAVAPFPSKQKYRRSLRGHPHRSLPSSHPISCGPSRRRPR